MRDRFGADVTWLRSALHRESPPEGVPRNPAYDRIRTRFEEQGLVYNPPQHVVPNTRNALRLTELARERGLGAQMHDRLMDAYWEEGRNIGDPDELRALAAEVGIDDPEVAWEDDRYLE